MRIFLTGASGFVGSHVLDSLLDAGHEVAVLLRRTSNTRFISRHLAQVSVHYGSLGDQKVLKTAMTGCDAAVHCAGLIKALDATEFFRVNQSGTRCVVLAANASRDSLRHLIYISSLAVSGPGVPGRPAEEDPEPRPVTVYGESKRLGEIEIRQGSRVPWTILRPAAVYGPRDQEFLPVFQNIKRRFMPLLSGAKRRLNMIYGPDVAAAVLCSLAADQAAGKTYHLAAQPPCTDEEFMEEIARSLDVRPFRVRIPRAGLYLACAIQEFKSTLTGRPSLLCRQKMPELLAPGWVCDTDKILRELGFAAPTSLKEGVARTAKWYQREGWL